MNYSTHDFIFSDGVNSYPVNDQVDLPAYTQNQHMLYTQSGLTDYDVYEPFFHLKWTNCSTAMTKRKTYHRFYGWDATSQSWNMTA